MIAFTVSRFVRHAVAAWLGVHYGRGVLHLWQDITARWGDAFLIVLWSIILLFSGYAFFKLYRTSRRGRRSLAPATGSAGPPRPAADPQPDAVSVHALVNSICAGSYATRSRQPRQVRKEATVTGHHGRSRETRYIFPLKRFLAIKSDHNMTLEPHVLRLFTIRRSSNGHVNEVRANILLLSHCRFLPPFSIWRVPV